MGVVMKFNIKALAFTVGLIWGGAMLLVTLANLIWPGYGQAFLEVIASIYPGFVPGGGVSSVIVGTIYGLVDGAIGGAIFGWLYNYFAKQ
jgi:hypothetical protein